MAVVFVQQGGDIEALALCDLDEIEEGAEFLGLHVGEPVKIILTEPREQSQGSARSYARRLLWSLRQLC